MKVALMVTCLGDTVAPQVPRATVRLLERLGCEVTVPPQQACCGQMHVNSGFLTEAVPVVRNFVAAFAGADHVVAPSGSCVGSVRHQHRLVAARSGDAGLAGAVEEVAPRVWELTEFLVDVLRVTDVGAVFPHRVTYHPTCHSLRLLGVGDRPRRLLEAVSGVDLVDLPGADECCGFGGTFALKNSAVSTAMGLDKIAAITDSGAAVVTAGDASCLLHIWGLLSRQRSPVRVMHLAEILAEDGTS